jgi:starch synthase (maltosyl-transferring)
MGKPEEGRKRVVVEGVTPQIDAGRFPAKRIAGDEVAVEANVFGDGHDHVYALLKYKRKGAKDWKSVAMESLGNDRWRGLFPVEEQGRYIYTVVGGEDHFDTWRSDLEKRLKAAAGAADEVAAVDTEQAAAAREKHQALKEDVALALRTGSLLISETARRAKGDVCTQLKKAAKAVAAEDLVAAATAALEPALATTVAGYPDTKLETWYERELEVLVDREKARYSTWYELFPRSAGTEGVHGTFKDVEGKLDYVAGMGFDVLYMPPIHPIGRSYRKGRNNTTTALEGDVGSPWAIGAAEGGHTAILPELGTMKDFEHLVSAAAEKGLEIALDIAFQCAPEHPWVTEHPDWFKHRADGSIQYAENPPKKYQDIYPLDFESKDWGALWTALRDVFLFWAQKGVRIFRVDNPHTKAFPFWEWAIGSIKKKYPDALFLAEAFTRPRVMEQLAKAGFSQSYTYFSWRNTKEELTTYATELTQLNKSGDAQWEYFRPNFWPNTPDILPVALQTGGRAAFMARLVLAATLASSYGIYGAAYELEESAPFRAGGEEYLWSEKYELKHWDTDSPKSLAPFITSVNAARKANPALHRMDQSLWFHTINNDQLICYSKATPDKKNVVLTIVNLDYEKVQSGWVYLDMTPLGLAPTDSFLVEDALSGAAYQWAGPSNYVRLDPGAIPAHVFRVTPIV